MTLVWTLLQPPRDASISFTRGDLNIASHEDSLPRIKENTNTVKNFRSLVMHALSGGALVLSACTTVDTSTAPQGGTAGVRKPDLGFFSKIKVPDDREPVLKLRGRGAQVFRCEKVEGKGLWVFRQPDAELLDDAGRVVGRHGANVSFEHVDGSRLVATIAAYDDAPKPTDLKWLLFTTKSYGKGAFDGVTNVQRINTSGGIPPAGCDLAHAGRVLRIDFTSDFVFYRPRASSAQ